MGATAERGVAWAFLHDGGAFPVVVVVAPGMVATHMNAEWGVTFHDDPGWADGEAVEMTERAEAAGMRLFAGPELFDLPAGCTAQVAVERGMRQLCRSTPVDRAWGALKRAWNKAYEPGAFPGAGASGPAVGYLP